MKRSEWLGWLPKSEEDVIETVLRTVELIRAAREGEKEIIRLEAENVALHKRLDKKFELIAQQGQELNRRDEIIKKQEKDIDAYAQSARAIALHLDRFCDRGLPYADMIADAARKAHSEIAEKNKEIERLMDNLQKQDDAALAELQRRQNKITQLKYEIARVTAERDAAIEDCSGMCITCAFVHDCAKHDNNDMGPSIWHCDCEDWQWRGPQKEDGGNDD